MQTDTAINNRPGREWDEKMQKAPTIINAKHILKCQLLYMNAFRTRSPSASMLGEQ
jgi:hypothetical protein